MGLIPTVPVLPGFLSLTLKYSFRTELQLGAMKPQSVVQLADASLARTSVSKYVFVSMLILAGKDMDIYSQLGFFFSSCMCLIFTHITVFETKLQQT